jgi:hypothetical protein
MFHADGCETEGLTVREDMEERPTQMARSLIDMLTDDLKLGEYQTASREAPGLTGPRPKAGDPGPRPAVAR